MVNVVGSKDDSSRWKPEGFEHYLTMAEVCRIVKRDRRRLTMLEAEGKLPRPIRVKAGCLQVRLYSPDDVARVKDYFKNAKPGRPKEVSE